VLFGAGASYGSGVVAPTVPPLGSQLFPVLRRLYASWRAVPDEAAAQFHQNFEKGMALVIERYSMAIGPLMQDMAVFFSGFTIPPNSPNRYVSIVAATMTRGDILWSTLNYECLLEFAAARNGKPVAYFNESEEAFSNAVPIWKLHGSCNFKVTGLEATRGISFGSGVIFGGGIEPLDPSAVRAHYRGNTALYPAMALFAEGKPIAMSPAPIQDAQRRWGEHIGAADRVLLIGVNPNPADAHLWVPLAETRADLGFVGDASAFDAWRHAHRPLKPCRFLGELWEEAELEVIEFLRS
jgi:hypothetical protein